MFSKEFSTKEIPSLNLDDSGSIVLTQMEDFKLKHLPVVNEGNYICLISEKDIFQMQNPDCPIKDITIFAPYVGEESSVLDVLRIMNKNRLTLLPVVNLDGEYKGAITQSRLLEQLDELCNKDFDGALIALEVNPQEYSLSQIIHLAEQNNANVLSMFSYIEEETSKQIVLLKIDLEDASPILRSFERFNYTIKYHTQKQGLNDETMQNRLSELMYYLEM